MTSTRIYMLLIALLLAMLAYACWQWGKAETELARLRVELQDKHDNGKVYFFNNHLTGEVLYPPYDKP
jgi:hypothetical protein